MYLRTVRRLRCTEMRMVRWICGASLNDRPGGIKVVNEELESGMRTRIH